MLLTQLRPRNKNEFTIQNNMSTNYCIGITRSGDPCTNKSKYGQHCFAYRYPIDPVEPIEVKICIALTKNGTQCTYKCKDRDYCGRHQPIDKLTVENVICSAITKEGNPCTNKCKEGLYCGKHKSLDKVV